MLMILKYIIAEELKRERTSNCLTAGLHRGELLCLDAGAEEDDVAIGGWLTNDFLDFVDPGRNGAVQAVPSSIERLDSGAEKSAARVSVRGSSAATIRQKLENL